MERITESDIEAMRARGYDRTTIADAMRKAELGRRADGLIRRIELAFADVTLGDGTGLTEAKAKDDSLAGCDFSVERAADEKADWTRIADAELNRCDAAWTYMNDRGRSFHLPAFMCADLRGAMVNGFDDRLADPEAFRSEFVALLTETQRSMVLDYLLLLHEAYQDHDAAQDRCICRVRRLLGVAKRA